MEKAIEQLYDYPTIDANGMPIGVINDAQATGGGGGGTNNPPFVQTTAVTTSNPLNFYLKTNNGESAEFFADGVSYGIGTSVTIAYNPSTSFGSKRVFTAKTTSGRVLSRFEVTIISIIDYNNVQTEGVRITEFINDVPSSPKTFNSTFGTYTLEFFIDSVVIPTIPVVEPAPAPAPTVIDTITTPNPNINYEIVFGSNFDNEIGNALSLKYDIVSSDDLIIDSNTIATKNSKTGQISRNVLNGGKVNFQVNGNLPDGYSLVGIFSGLTKNAGTNLEIQYDKLNKQNYAFSLPASSLGESIIVLVKLQKEIKVSAPTITLGDSKFNVFVKESDVEKELAIPFISENTDFIRIYLSETKTIDVPASDKLFKIYFKKDFAEEYGIKKIIIVPYSNSYGTGERKEILVTYTSVNDYPSITEIIAIDNLDVPAFSDFNLEYEITYTSYSTTNVDSFLKLKNGNYVPFINSLPSNGSLKINLKKLREDYKDWEGSDNITIKFKPFNRGGAEELIGNDYEITTKLNIPSIYLDENMISNALFESFAQSLQIIEPEKESKYLTHLANFGDDNQFLISSWEEDNWTLSKKSEDELGNVFVKDEDVVKSLILKLYSPLSANITNNSTFWITKMMANPLVETVVLTEQDNLKCPPLKGPNFNLDIDFITGESTNFESLDTLILSASVSSSSQLVSQYLSSSFNDTTDLNIEYTDGSTYLWNNFVHFSSAKERVDNFVYKVQLIEVYEQSISASYYNPTGLNHTSSLSAKQEREKQQIKKDQLVNGFDGFEKFLYTSSSLSWPYVGTTRVESSNIVVSNWYDNIITLAEDYDVQNSNWVQNNIPQYIVNNEENDQYLLFLSMIGQHFDNIYYYTKAIERSRGLGYNSSNQMSDRLLYDTLKSFGWDAQNLAADSNLWKYVFGQDSEGNVVETNPAKKRTNEVWKRIVNNLPYLLKNKGTRKGIYALLACYGIPSSNLSIIEFGGPEVTDSSKSKYEFDNISTALKMSSGSYVEMEWKTTDKGTKPNTIELFMKPTKSNSTYTIVSGSGWSLQTSGSLTSDYGKVQFYYSGSSKIESTLLPIYNGSFFGVAISSGSNGLQLSLRQSNKDRTLFEETISGSHTTNWNNGSYIKLGGNYSGSIDEFRLWSDVLNTDVFYEHVSFPEMINGNNTLSSTNDLYFRLDFEYPKNLAYSSSLINVDTNIYFEDGLTRNDYENGTTASLYSNNITPLLSASAYGFDNIETYPYQFEAIDRSVIMDMPNVGSSRYSTNKVRFEEQTLISDLSAKSRATVKAFDQSPTDSNRVGLFFSPTKELNIDIAKSFGGINLDNYIGDPSDRYNSNYKSLDSLRHYYFKRFKNKDIYSYINLIKLYEKSMFEDIKKMLPARVKATTGLLIEPHFLERSKVQHKKPTGDDYQQEVSINYSDTTTTLAENQQFDIVLNTANEQLLNGENQQYDALIDSTSNEQIISDSYQQDATYEYIENTKTIAENYQEEVSIKSNLDNPTILSEVQIYDMMNVVGQTPYEEVGFGIYAQNGYAIRTYFNAENVIVKERIKVDLIKEQKQRDVLAYNVVINGQGDARGGYHVTSSIYYETKLNIQPFSGSKVINAGTGSIVEVKPLNGYLPTHYRNTSDLTTGLRNSYYLGSKNTAATTLDGTPPVETFVTNPNTLKVNKANRGADEPILEVD